MDIDASGFSLLPKTVYLEKYDHLILFLDTALIPCDQRVHVFAPNEEGLYIPNIV